MMTSIISFNIAKRLNFISRFYIKGGALLTITKRLSNAKSDFLMSIGRVVIST